MVGDDYLQITHADAVSPYYFKTNFPIKIHLAWMWTEYFIEFILLGVRFMGFPQYIHYND